MLYIELPLKTIQKLQLVQLGHASGLFLEIMSFDGTQVMCLFCSSIRTQNNLSPLYPNRQLALIILAFRKSVKTSFIIFLRHRHQVQNYRKSYECEPLISLHFRQIYYKAEGVAVIVKLILKKAPLVGSIHTLNYFTSGIPQRQGFLLLSHYC